MIASMAPPSIPEGQHEELVSPSLVYRSRVTSFSCPSTDTGWSRHFLGRVWSSDQHRSAQVSCSASSSSGLLLTGRCRSVPAPTWPFCFWSHLLLGSSGCSRCPGCRPWRLNRLTCPEFLILDSAWAVLMIRSSTPSMPFLVPRPSRAPALMMILQGAPVQGTQVGPHAEVLQGLGRARSPCAHDDGGDGGLP